MLVLMEYVIVCQYRFTSLSQPQIHAYVHNPFVELPRAFSVPAVPCRYVEYELLSMKSLFEQKEAGLQEELRGERELLAQEIEVLRQRAQEATARRTIAEVRELVSL